MPAQRSPEGGQRVFNRSRDRFEGRTHRTAGSDTLIMGLAQDKGGILGGSGRAEIIRRTNNEHSRCARDQTERGAFEDRTLDKHKMVKKVSRFSSSAHGSRGPFPPCATRFTPHATSKAGTSFFLSAVSYLHEKNRELDLQDRDEAETQR